jgi:hypothetical protein
MAAAFAMAATLVRNTLPVQQGDVTYVVATRARMMESIFHSTVFIKLTSLLFNHYSLCSGSCRCTCMRRCHETANSRRR